MQFDKYIFNLFPLEIRATDSYKNSQGQGLLERYVGVFENELDEHYIKFIESFIENVFDLITMQDKLLGHMGSNLGFPVTPDSNKSFYRFLLAWAVRLYELKGTKKAYELYFKLLGFQVEIENQPLGRGAIYDIAEIYYDHGMTDPVDDSDIEDRYDEECDYCSTYDIAIKKIDDPTWVITDSWKNYFAPVIIFLEPINAKLRNYVPLP